MERTDESWAEIPGFPHYQVSSYGNIYSAKTKRLLSGRTSEPGGPLRVLLTSYRGDRDVYIHHLVAEAFMRDYRPGTAIIHVDGNNRNNHISNLRAKSGIPAAKARYQARHIRGGKVRVLETGEVFRNAYSAAKHYNIDSSTIYKVLRGERKRAFGMRFEFYREEDHYAI